MQIKTTHGHLTAHDKRVLVAILKANGNGAKTPLKTFRVEGNDVWVTMSSMEWSGPRMQTHKSSFIVLNKDSNQAVDA